jgi:hypothetical protein
VQINGYHESQITDWPKESSIEIKVRGLGTWGFEDEIPETMSLIPTKSQEEGNRRKERSIRRE